MKADHDCNYEPDAKFIHANYLLELKNGGYPFEANDLTLQEWKWIAELNTAIEKFSIFKNRKN